MPLIPQKKGLEEKTEQVHMEDNIINKKLCYCVSRSLVNLCTTIRTSCTSYQQQNRVVDFLVDRRVMNCVRWHVDRRDYGQHARPSASFVDNPIDKVPEKSSLILEIPEFLYNKV